MSIWNRLVNWVTRGRRIHVGGIKPTTPHPSSPPQKMRPVGVVLTEPVGESGNRTPPPKR